MALISKRAQLWKNFMGYLSSAPGVTGDWVDQFFHRPAASLILIFWLTLPKFLHPSPNFVTFLSMIFALLGSFMCAEIAAGASLLPFSFAVTLGVDAGRLQVLGGASMMLSSVLDCGDGQLARLQKAANPLGRYIDGLADIIGTASYLLCLNFIMKINFGDPGLVVAFLAATCLQQTLNFYDKTKSAYTILTRQKGYAQLTRELDRAGLRRQMEKEMEGSTVVENFMAKFKLWYAEGLKLDSEIAAIKAKKIKVKLEDRQAAMRLVSLSCNGGQIAVLYVAMMVAPTISDYAVFAIGFQFLWYALNFFIFRRAKSVQLLSQKNYFQFEMFKTNFFVFVGFILLFSFFEDSIPNYNREHPVNYIEFSKLFKSYLQPR